MIRPAALRDVPGIMDLAMEALNDDPYETWRIDRDKVKAVAIECISGASNFAWVCEENGEIVASVVALVHPMTFYERSQATVMQFYSRGKNGQGVRLIKEFLRWAKGRPIIKHIVFTLERNADPRIEDVLTRLGMTNKLKICSLVK